MIIMLIPSQTILPTGPITTQTYLMFQPSAYFPGQRD